MKIQLITLLAAGGLLVGCDRSIEGASQDYNQLPPAVQKTVRAQAPNGEIAKISRKENDGRVIYEVEFKDKGKNPSIRVAEDGTLVQELQK